MNNNLIIGMDCGASHTKVCVWKMGEKVFETSDWPGMNMDLLNDGRAVEVFTNKLNELGSYDNGFWVIALAGVDNDQEEIEATNWWKRYLTAKAIKFAEIKIMSDIDLVLWAGSKDGVGVGLIAGTGSNALGRDAKGNEYKVGGMSHLMSDEGSGFALGWKCLRLVTKMNDGRLPKTKLVKDILDFYGMKTVVDLKNYLLKSTLLKAEIARCTPVLFEAVKNDDQEVLEIIDSEINELVLMTVTINRLMSPHIAQPVYLAGSLFQNEYYFAKFIENLHLSYPEQEVSRIKPIEGVVNFVNSLRF